MPDVLAGFADVCSSGDGWSARCPAHDDHHRSLSIHHRDGRWLLKCHAGCSWREIVTAAGLKPAQMFDDGAETPPGKHATSQPRARLRKRKNSRQSGQAAALNQSSQAAGLTLDKYAAAKAVPMDFLKTCGISQFNYDHNPALRIPYLGESGEELAIRFRLAMEGDRFRWKSGAKPALYGLNRLADARKAGYVVLVEGESDCHTLWWHGIPALGLPGAANWREERDARHFAGIKTIYVVVEPDRGGDAVRDWLSRSVIRHQVRLLELQTKDVSELHLKSPDDFKANWQVACLGGLPWTVVEAETNAAERAEAWNLCKGLADESDILRKLDAELAKLGVVGERRNAKLLYLSVTSRILEKPVSVAVKGPSSGGKSFLVESILKFFPPAAYYSLTAMSDRALAYSNEPLRHRHLVIFEAAGMTSDFATYLIRSLLSEGCIRYETVEKTRDGLAPRLIEREGPTGLIVTTTSLHLHPENETRMLSVTVADNENQTAAVFRALAHQGSQTITDRPEWHALQIWLATGPTHVAIPFVQRLAELIPPVAVRLRRDFKTLLILIQSHALLHQATRRKDGSGRVIAELSDYTAVRELVGELIAEGVGATVRSETRELVDTVRRLLADGRSEIRQTDLRPLLRLDKSAISRRVAAALSGGFLKNQEDRKGRPARLVLGDPIPADQDLLPAPELLGQHDQLHSCTRDEGSRTPPEASIVPATDSDQQSSESRRVANSKWTGRI